MIVVNRHLFPNGLRLLHHYDGSTPMVAVNTLYDVGSKDENPERTGFAHLFEHLMFGGSLHIPSYDAPLQEIGGENNAWTSNDITNYYCVVPHENIETAFWLESDRMLSLNFSQESLEVQRKVVIEEFKQRNLNQPYGDMSMLLRPLVYTKHPYRWSTIGKEISHIEEATLEEVKNFFFTHYAPNNAILSVAGNISFEETLRLAEKWFAPIPRREIALRTYSQEPPQTAQRSLTVEREVPLSALTLAFHMVPRSHPHYHRYDLLSDLLAGGRSARLYQNLVMDQELFADLNAYITGDIDAGMFIIKGTPNPHISLEQAEEAIWIELQKLIDEPIASEELQKVINKFESNDLFSNINYLNKATNLAYYELIGKAEDINTEVQKYLAITPAMVQETAKDCFVHTKCSTLYYRKILTN